MNFTTIAVALSVSLNKRCRNVPVVPSQPQLCSSLPQELPRKGVLDNSRIAGCGLIKDVFSDEHELQLAAASDFAGATMGAY
jgi:hypothetical protein